MTIGCDQSLWTAVIGFADDGAVATSQGGLKEVPVGAVLAGMAAFIAAAIVLSRFLRRQEREGHFDKEGHGSPKHQEPGVKYRPLEVPGREPFD